MPLPTTDQIRAFTRLANVILVHADVGGTKGLLVVDTGDPFAYLTSSAFPCAPVAGSEGTFDVGTTDLSNVQVVTVSGAQTSPDPAISLGGLLGCTVLCSHTISFDYREAVFSLEGASAPSGVGPAVSLDFAFEGGGLATASDGTVVTEPRSRMVLNVDIEGTVHRMLLDTGASALTVSQSVFDEITKDGRKTLTIGKIDTTLGASVPSYTRVKTVSVGGARVDSVVVAHDSQFDGILTTVSKEVGQTIDGSLGGTFLEHFFLTIDYAAKVAHVAPYTDTSFIVDLAQNVGLALGGAPGPDGVTVGAVLAGSDAESKGVSVGDLIVSIDDTKTAPLTVSQAAILLAGKVGSTKSVTFGSAKHLAHETVSLIVRDALPLP